MGPVEVVTVARRILEQPVKTAHPQPGTEANTEAVERLIQMVAAFLSLDDPQLQSTIYAEAQNRLMVSNAIGRRPWELGR